MSWNLFQPKRTTKSAAGRSFFGFRKKRNAFATAAGASKFPFGMAALWLAAGLVAAYTLLFSSLHEIDIVLVTGARELGDDRLESEAREFISQRLFLVFPGNNYFLFSGNRLERDLMGKFPKLSSVRIEKHFPHAIDVSVTERDRIFLWCSGGGCLLIDEKGCAGDAQFAEQETNDPFLVRFTDESAVPMTAGDCSVSPDLPDTVLRLERGVREEAGIVLRLPAFTPSRISREIRFRTEEGWEIWMNSDIPPEKTLAALRAVLETEIAPEARVKLRYIDLRTENKAFYSFIQENPAPEAEEDKKDTEDGEEKKED